MRIPYITKVIIVPLLSFTYIGLSHADHNYTFSMSEALGGTGGTLDVVQKCIADKSGYTGYKVRMTGIAAKYGTVIDSVATRCSEKVQGNWHIGQFSQSTAPLTNISNRGSINCSAGSYVYGISGSVQNKVVKNLKIHCASMNANGTRSNTDNTHQIGDSEGANITYPGLKSCPNNGFAYGMKVKRGWHVDSLQLLCASPSKHFKLPPMSAPKSNTKPSMTIRKPVSSQNNTVNPAKPGR